MVYIQWFCKWAMKALISMCKSAVWSGPVLPASCTSNGLHQAKMWIERYSDSEDISEKGSALRNKFFPFREDPFSKRFGAQESNKKSQKIVSLVQNGEKPTKYMYIVPLKHLINVRKHHGTTFGRWGCCLNNFIFWNHKVVFPWIHGLWVWFPNTTPY